MKKSKNDSELARSKRVVGTKTMKQPERITEKYVSEEVRNTNEAELSSFQHTFYCYDGQEIDFQVVVSGTFHVQPPLMLV